MLYQESRVERLNPPGEVRKVFLDSLSWDRFWRMKGIGKVVKVGKGISG